MSRKIYGGQKFCCHYLTTLSSNLRSCRIKICDCASKMSCELFRRKWGVLLSRNLRGGAEKIHENVTQDSR